jgi:hypothetical protein
MVCAIYDALPRPHYLRSECGDKHMILLNHVFNVNLKVDYMNGPATDVKMHR